MNEPLPIPERALAIGAHPDDIEFGAGATLARWADSGCRVVMAIVTDGSKGTWDPRRSPADLATAREREQQAAAAVIGAADVLHLGYVDGELENSSELRSRIARVIRLHTPNIVLSHDPWQRYQLHPDHRATGMGVVDGVVAARDPLFFPDHGIAHHRPDTLLLWSADEPDHAEAIDDPYIERKLEALLCHASQAETTMDRAHDGEDQRARFEQRVRSWAERLGEPFGAPLAETFKRITP